ncbi:glycosyltransferase [Sulfobacillus thermosulfidooxidans]|uniref:glycosyltransferase n=1 Tax=Sulfobacillus thermosulfidooxidans TaxID=28034 RepID=UPI00096BA865|nr:glycosyltransferase [Sulfobacillus thermosulfidooxidans]OLZ10347.1 hypothetical protein BFX05_10155 [Sulfobacillus thermosulfidooxidans]OLZ17396.1 hypothetical protein BFX06_13450 [Sulfobacillus thermosulfidooxidans]OLZ21094.1 hypothetical protein BFX07_13845 [Sulfobacillus thermosulfidooxidans]
MQVSVALATYNGEKYLLAQLDSLARQTYRPHEVVIADDGSGDQTREIILEFSRSAPFPVKLIVGQHVGYIDNFFRAAAACEGEVIAFCDQDDIWLPEKIERCMQYFTEDVSLVMHSAQVIDSTGTRLPHTVPIIRHRAKMSRGRFGDGPLKSFPLGFSLMFRRSVIQAINQNLSSYPDVHRHYFGHEMPVYWMAKAMGNVVYLPDIYVLYRRHASNVSQGTHPKTGQWVDGLHNDASQYQEFGEHAQYQAELLRLLKGSDPIVDDILEKWALTREKLSGNFLERASLYRTHTWSDKWAVMKKLLQHHGYAAREHGGLGWKSLMKDFVFLWR